jgi:hypothetical protein
MDEAEKSDRRRVNVICIASSPNSQLVNELTEAGGGESKYLNGDANEGDISSALDNILTQWEDPIATNMVLRIDQPGAQAIGRTVKTDAESSSIDLGDLPAGRAVWVSGRVPKAKRLKFLVVCNNKVVTMDQPKEYNFCPATKSLFGARRIQELEFVSNFDASKKKAALKKMGYDDVLDLKKLIANESLSYGIPSSETSFVAIRRNSNAKIEGTIDVPSAMPEAWECGVGTSILRCASASVGFSGCSGYSGIAGQVGLAGFYSPLHTAHNWNVGSSRGAMMKMKKFSSQNLVSNKLSDQDDVSFCVGASDIDPDVDLKTSFMNAMNTFPNVQSNYFTSGGGGGGASCSAGSVNNNLLPGEFVINKKGIIPKLVGSCTVMGKNETIGMKPLYTGTPKNDEVLYESDSSGSFKKIQIEFLNDISNEDLSNVFILLYVGDMNVAKARIRLKDFVRYSQRPLSLNFNNEAIKIVMAGTTSAKMVMFLL